MTTIPVFVYGTLRPGDYNHDRFPGGVRKILRNCKTEGRLYHAFPDSGRIYPGARFDEKGTIVGDILAYDKNSESFHSVCRMEIGVGYSMREIKVETENGVVIDAVGFHYDRPHGPLIESGDWFAEDAYDATSEPEDDAWDEDTVLCDHCQWSAAEFMYPDGEATFFACPPCKAELDKKAAEDEYSKEEHDPDRWKEISS